MLKIIIIRHGRTRYNKERIYRGRIDISLDVVGKKEIKHLAQRLQISFNIKKIYTSPLRRAFETAKIIAKNNNIEIIKLNELIDINFGKFEGEKQDVVIENYPRIYNTFITQPHKVRFPEGESLSNVRSRVKQALNRIIKENEDGDVAIVSHRVINKVLILELLGLDLSHFWQVRQDTAAFTVFEKTNYGFILTLHNDTCHIKEFGDRIDF